MAGVGTYLSAKVNCMGILDWLKSFNTSCIIYKRGVKPNSSIFTKDFSLEKFFKKDKGFAEGLKAFEDGSKKFQPNLLRYWITTKDKSQHGMVGFPSKDGKIIYGNMLTSKYRWLLKKSTFVPSLFGYMKDTYKKEYEQYISAHMNLDEESIKKIEYQPIDLRESLTWQGSSFDELTNLDKANFMISHKNEIIYSGGQPFVKTNEVGKNYIDILDLDNLPDNTRQSIINKNKIFLTLRDYIKDDDVIWKVVEEIKNGPKDYVVTKLIINVAENTVEAQYAHINDALPYNEDKVLDTLGLGEILTHSA